MKDKEIIGFEVSKEFKDRVIKAGKGYKIDGVSNPVNLSMLCRIAVARLVSEIEIEERDWLEFLDRREVESKLNNLQEDHNVLKSYLQFIFNHDHENNLSNNNKQKGGGIECQNTKPAPVATG